MLKLTKKGDKYWLFEDSEIGLFSPSKFTINLLNNDITIVYENGLKSKAYNVIDCEIYDLGSLVPFTTSSGNEFMTKLEELNCPCFQKNENVYTGGTLQQVTDVGNVTTNNISVISNVNDEFTAIYSNSFFSSDDLQYVEIKKNLIRHFDSVDSFESNIKFRTKTQNTDFYFEDEGGEKSIATREWVNAKIYDIIKLGVTTNATPTDGDVWLESNTNTGLKIRINGVTKTINLS